MCVVNKYMLYVSLDICKEIKCIIFIYNQIKVNNPFFLFTYNYLGYLCVCFFSIQKIYQFLYICLYLLKKLPNFSL